MSRRGRTGEARWLQIGKEKLLHDVEQKKLSLVEACRVIKSSPLPENVQKDLTLADGTSKRLIIGFDQAMSSVAYLMKEKELLEEELQKARSKNPTNKEELTELRNKYQTQADELKVLNSVKEKLAAQISNFEKALEKSKEENKAQAIQISNLTIKNESLLANQQHLESEKEKKNAEIENLLAELKQKEMEVGVMEKRHQSMIDKLDDEKNHTGEINRELENLKTQNLTQEAEVRLLQKCCVSKQMQLHRILNSKLS